MNSESVSLEDSDQHKARQSQFIVSHQPLPQFSCGRVVIIHYYVFPGVTLQMVHIITNAPLTARDKREPSQLTLQRVQHARG